MATMTQAFLSPAMFSLEDWEKMGRRGVEDFTNTAIFEHLFFAIELGMEAARLRSEGMDPHPELLDELSRKGRQLKRFAEIAEANKDEIQ